MIGPTTGIAGIFRGPLYYYLIAPFYWLSDGDPVWPANFLSFTTILAGGMLYYLGFRAQSRATGLFAAIISSFSMYLIFSSRWLSNPTPMFLLSTVLLFFMFRIIDGKKWAWTGVALVSGLSLFHFGSSGEFFYFPAILVFAIWQIVFKKKYLSLKIVLASSLLFLFTLMPLVLFDFKNDHLLSRNISKFLFEKESFRADFITVLGTRLNLYHQTFGSEIFPVLSGALNIILGAILVSFAAFLPSFIKNTKIATVLLVIAAPVFGLLFFQGNEGNVYGYYLTGYYLVFVLMFSVVVGKLWRFVPGKILVLIFLGFFFVKNIPPSVHKMNNEDQDPTTITLKHQKQAIDWIYQDAAGESFNIDVYVPPVIPYAYDYLFLWYPNSRQMDYGNTLVEEHVPLLYTLYEIDPPHPDRINAWHTRQEGIGEVKYEKTFGGITVQRRSRL